MTVWTAKQFRGAAEKKFKEARAATRKRRALERQAGPTPEGKRLLQAALWADRDGAHLLVQAIQAEAREQRAQRAEDRIK